MIQFTAKNGINYTVRFVGQNLEIERHDEATGLQKVFVFKDFSIGDFTKKRKEVTFESYIILNDQRIDKKTIVLPDSPEEVDAFMTTALMASLRDHIVDVFLRENDYTAKE